MALARFENETGTSALRRVNTPHDMERLADRIERWLSRSRRESEDMDRNELAVYGFIIMGLRHIDQLIQMVEDNPENDAARLALDTIDDFRVESLRKTMEEFQL